MYDFDLYHCRLVTWDPQKTNHCHVPIDIMTKMTSYHSRWPVNNQVKFHWEIYKMLVLSYWALFLLSLSGSLMASVFLNWFCFGHCVFCHFSRLVLVAPLFPVSACSSPGGYNCCHLFLPLISHPHTVFKLHSHSLLWQTIYLHDQKPLPCLVTYVST